jgi:hypothetical protein
MFKHLGAKLTFLLLLLMLLLVIAPLALAQKVPSNGTPNPKAVPQVAIPADTNVPAYGEMSHHFNIRPEPKKKDYLDLGNVIMVPSDPYKVYTNLQFDLLWFRKNHDALAVDFKHKEKEVKRN